MENPNNGDPNNGDNDPKTMSRADYIRKARAAMDERRQRAVSNRQQFEPQIHEQIQRLFQNYEAPFYARLRGFGKDQTLALAESTVLSLAAVNNRRFEDSETQALTEHFLSSVHNLLVWKWAMTGLAGYMTYRGRRTFRFPFFTPEYKGPWSPFSKIPAIRWMWHSARLVAYYGAIWVLGEPVFQGGNFMRQRTAMERDPRLRSLLQDGKAQSATLLGGGQETNSQINETWESASQQESSRQSRESESSTIASQTQSTWATYRTPTQSQPPPKQSDSWDSLPDDFDDTSPVSPAARSQSDDTNNYSGSAWDRIRQQSQYQPNQQNQKSWEKPQSGGGWGGEADAGAQSRGSQGDFSYSSADEEKSSSREQAQREFDRLLERERHGVDQERSSNSWSKR